MRICRVCPESPGPPVKGPFSIAVPLVPSQARTLFRDLRSGTLGALETRQQLPGQINQGYRAGQPVTLEELTAGPAIIFSLLILPSRSHIPFFPISALPPPPLFLLLPPPAVCLPRCWIFRFIAFLAGIQPYRLADDIWISNEQYRFHDIVIFHTFIKISDNNLSSNLSMQHTHCTVLFKMQSISLARHVSVYLFLSSYCFRCAIKSVIKIK